jgi:hypothetical protein
MVYILVIRMDRHFACLVLLSIVACSSEPAQLKAQNGTTACPTTSLQARGPSTALTVQQGQETQGQEQQGCQQQGTQLIGTPTDTPITSAYTGWWNRRKLKPGRVVEGRLVGDGGALSGAALAGTWIPSMDGASQVWLIVRSATQDPTYGDGSTWLYGLDVYDPATGVTSPFCANDAQGVSAAIPVAAIFDGTGSRVESSSAFTFGCTAGVLAKCVRWGYRPWLQDVTGSSSQFAALHWSCTRMARADYCGDGRSWTHNGTTINIWDTAPAPGPFQAHGPTDPTFIFEAGWNTGGAVCLSKERWATIDPAVAQDCPNRLIPPGAATPVGTVCESPTDASLFDPGVELFNESHVNVATP